MRRRLLVLAATIAAGPVHGLRARAMSIRARAIAMAALIAWTTACAASRSLAPEGLSPATAAEAAALANSRGWTVRVATLRGDTLVGQLTRADARTLRLKLRDIPLTDVASIERGVPKPDDGRQGTVVAASALVAGFVGILFGWAVAYARDGPCDACVRNGFMFGAVAGLVGAFANAQKPDHWELLWRRSQ